MDSVHVVVQPRSTLRQSLTLYPCFPCPLGSSSKLVFSVAISVSLTILFTRLIWWILSDAFVSCKTLELRWILVQRWMFRRQWGKCALSRTVAPSPHGLNVSSSFSQLLMYYIFTYLFIQYNNVFMRKSKGVITSVLKNPVTLSVVQMNWGLDVACGLNELRFKRVVAPHPADFLTVMMQSGLFLMCPVGSISLQCFGVTICKRSRCIRANAELLSSHFFFGSVASALYEEAKTSIHLSVLVLVSCLKAHVNERNHLRCCPNEGPPDRNTHSALT